MATLQATLGKYSSHIREGKTSEKLMEKKSPLRIIKS